MKTDKHGGNIYRYDRHMLDFSANLNPAGMPSEIRQAVIDSLEFCENYPDPEQKDLRKEIAAFHHVQPEQICCGNGAADIIFRIALSFKPKRALVVQPTFIEYREALETCECIIDEHLLKEENAFRPDRSVLPVIAAGHYDMVFFCSPNNPTGITAEKELVLGMAEACAASGARLVLDECFMDFALGEETESVMGDISSLPNLIILKSFTKYYAMAGIRLGYCVCGSTEDAEVIRGCMQAWPVATTASAAGIAALRLPDTRDETKAFIALQRGKLMAGLRSMGFTVYESQANYVFFKSPVALDEPLLAKNIMIRNCSNYHGLTDGYYRIAVRTSEENDYLLDALAEIMGYRRTTE